MGSKIIILLIHILSLIIIVRFISIVVVEILQKTGRKNDIHRATSLLPDNARTYRILGNFSQFDFIEVHYEQAVEHYRAALKRHPLYATAWLHLARVYMEQGEDDNAFSAINNLVKLDPRDPDIVWEIALFYLIHSKEKDRAITYLSYFLSLSQQQEHKVYDICYQMGYSPGFIANTFVKDTPERYVGYLTYLLSRKRYNEANEFYQSFEPQFLELLNEQKSLNVCNILIKAQMYDSALKLWHKVDKVDKKDLYSNSSVGFTNGSFEYNIRNKCFGWKINKKKDIQIAIDSSAFTDGQKSLVLSFAEDSEIPVTLFKQFVFLKAGVKYVFTASVMTEDLIFPRGVYFQIKGDRCSSLLSQSESIKGTNPLWKTLSMHFTAPSDCRGAYIYFKRGGEKKLTSVVKSKIWIDGLGLIESSKRK